MMKRVEKHKGKKKVLKVLSTPHKHSSERILDMPLMQYVFADSVERFYAHKQLSKFFVSYDQTTTVLNCTLERWWRRGS